MPRPPIFSDRIREIIQESGLSRRWICEHTKPKIPESTFSEFMAGRNRLPTRYVDALFRMFNITMKPSKATALRLQRRVEDAPEVEAHHKRAREEAAHEHAKHHATLAQWTGEGVAGTHAPGDVLAGPACFGGRLCRTVVAAGEIVSEVWDDEQGAWVQGGKPIDALVGEPFSLEEWRE